MEGKTVTDCNKCEDDVGAGTYSYDEAVELTGHGWYNILVLVACSVASLAVAVDIFGFSVVVAAANCDLKLDITLSGILNTIPLAGALCAIPWGYYADTKGRRKALLLASTVGFLFSALCSLSPSWQVMLALKLLNSLFSSVLFTLTMTYLGENTSGVRRRRFLFIMNSVNLGAEFVFYLTAYFVLPLGFSFFIPWLGIDFRAWRVYTLLISLPLALSALLLLPLYESPKLLVSIGKTDEALDVLRKIYKWNGGKGEYPVKRVSLNDDEELTTGSIRDFILKQAVPLFKPPLLWRTLQLFILGGICGSTNNMFLMWYPMIVNLFFKSTAGDSVGELSFCERVNSNATVDNEIEEYTCDDTISQYTIFAGIMLGLVFALMNLAVSMVAAYRRLVLMAIYLLSAVCLLLVNWLKEPVSNLIAFTMIQCTVIGFGSIGSYFVDLYPTSQRGLVSGLTNMFSRLMSMAGVNIVAALIISHCTLMFYLWSAVVASGVVLALFLPPDTKLYK